MLGISTAEVKQEQQELSKVEQFQKRAIELGVQGAKQFE